MVWVVACMSRTLYQIGGTSGLCDLCSIAWDDSDAIPHVSLFFGCTHTRSPEDWFITTYYMGHSTLDSAIPDKFPEIPSYIMMFDEKD